MRSSRAAKRPPAGQAPREVDDGAMDAEIQEHGIAVGLAGRDFEMPAVHRKFPAVRCERGAQRRRDALACECSLRVRETEAREREIEHRAQQVVRASVGAELAGRGAADREAVGQGHPGFCDRGDAFELDAFERRVRLPARIREREADLRAAAGDRDGIEIDREAAVGSGAGVETRVLAAERAERTAQAAAPADERVAGHR